MLAQYNASRFRYSTLRGRPVRVGTVPTGTIVYIQDGIGPMGPRGWFLSPVRRNPWIVEAWQNREYHPGCKGRPATTYMAGGHTAVVRSLRTGERRTVADWLILASLDY